MSFIELLLIALGLSMDAFAVSISNGLSMKRIFFKKALIIALAFGIFQGLMPLIGFFLSTSFSDLIDQWSHIIALILLGVIGGKMLVEGIGELRNKDKYDLKECDFNEKRLSLFRLFLQAIATSIDALIVGVGFAAMKVDILPAVSFIGIITFVLSLAGVYAGKKFSELLGSKAEIFGGLILIGIGMKVFIENTFF